MRIVLDMQGAQTESRFRGIGRYTLSLAQAIVQHKGDHEVILALNGLFPETIEPIRAAFYEILPQENILVWNTPGPVNECEPGNDWQRESAEYIREAFLASLHPDVVHIMSLFEGYADDAVTSVGSFSPHIPTVVTFYDLIPLLNPETYLTPNPAYANYYQRKVGHLKRAHQLLAISEAAANEGRNTLSLEIDTITNISTACDSIFQPKEIPDTESNLYLEPVGIKRPFILYSGGADARKNLKRLINAFAAIPISPDKTHQLVLAGKMPDGEMESLKKTAHAAGIEKENIVFTGYITDPELVNLYNLCTVFIFPSYHEGFGLPALEAMSCGAPVIGSNISSIPEVIDNPDALFDPYNESSITNKLVEVLGNKDLRDKLKTYGLSQAKKFSWDESAKKAIAVFEKLHEKTTNHLPPITSDTLQSTLIQHIAKITPPNIPEKKLLHVAYAISRIHSGAAPKQLLVDISELVQRDARTGIQRVTRSILKELLENPPNDWVVKPVYATPQNSGYYYAQKFTDQFGSNITSDVSDTPIDFHPGDIFLGLDLQHHVISSQKNYLATLRSNGVNVFFIVYDLLPILLPHTFPEGATQSHTDWLNIVTVSDGAICISKAVADELKTWMQENTDERLRPFKVGWFHLGADVKNSAPSLGLPDNANHVLDELTQRPTFLAVGTIEPRKGQAQILAAFELLWKQNIDVNLVIVGKKGWMIEQLITRLYHHPERNKRLFWLDGISDEYLEKIYAASTCLIAASEGEGFGLPLIEAAHHNLSIIARDIPVFREVAGEHAFYFSGKEACNLSDAIQHWLHLHAEHCAPYSHLMPSLTWQESAKQILDIIFKK
jgi:glycosyltransferase involved in cell wall biosynthesis